MRSSKLSHAVELPHVVGWSFGAGEVAADEPVILGSLAKVDVLKDSISCGKHQCDIPMPCSLGPVVCGARRVERPPADNGGTEAAQEQKDAMDGAETWHIPALANTSPMVPKR